MAFCLCLLLAGYAIYRWLTQGNASSFCFTWVDKHTVGMRENDVEVAWAGVVRWVRAEISLCVYFLCAGDLL